MPNCLFDALFAPHTNSDKTLLILKDGTNISCKSLLTRSARFAHVLRSFDITPGERIAVQINKSPDALALYAAAIQTGAVFLPLNTAYEAQEIAYFLQDSGARLLICDPDKETDLSPIAAASSIHLLTMSGTGTGSLPEAARKKDISEKIQPVDRSPDDLAALLYTSGTTGRSKGAMLTHQNLLSNAKVLVDAWGFSAQDVLLHALPIFHTHGLFVAINVSLLAGSPMIFLPTFQLDDVVSMLGQATSMMGVPTFYTRLLQDERLSKDLVQHMRLFISGSAPLLAETHDAFEKRTGHRILERYGMTETNMNTSNPLQGERRAGTVGFPLPGVDLKITDPETGKTLKTGETGMIEVRGPNVFSGYWGMPEKTREELRDDGFFITGDLAKMDTDGYIHIIGRSKDLIISGGYNIYPKEIELLLDEVDGVLESAVVGVPHPDFGEGAIGILVPMPGATPDLDDILSQLVGKIARFKQPKKLFLIDELPRNTMGKVQKNLLRDQYANSFK